MIKRCPACNRTYSDEGISFCLADGALLSAPYGDVREEPPPTEILPASHSPVPPTEPAKLPTPTLTSLSGAQGYSPTPTIEPKPIQWRYPILGALAIVAIIVILIGGFAARRVFTNKGDATASSSPEPLTAQTPATVTITPDNLASATATPVVPKSNSTPASTPSSNVVQPSPVTRNSPTPAKGVEPDPVLFPPDTRNTGYGDPKKSEATDYSRVFSQREVDVKAQLLERPKPAYTDSARQNNVQGRVVLRVVLSANGSVGSISAISGLSHGLTEQAIAAAKRIKFVPAVKDGRQVSAAVTVEYNFSVY